jgi:hypothetical protein
MDKNGLMRLIMKGLAYASLGGIVYNLFCMKGV